MLALFLVYGGGGEYGLWMLSSRTNEELENSRVRFLNLGIWLMGLRFGLITFD